MWMLLTALVVSVGVMSACGNGIQPAPTPEVESTGSSLSCLHLDAYTPEQILAESPLDDDSAIRIAVRKACWPQPGRYGALQATKASVHSIAWKDYKPRLGDSAIDYPLDDQIAVVTLSGIGDGCTFTVDINRRTGHAFHTSLKGSESEDDAPTRQSLGEDHVSLHNVTHTTTDDGAFVVSGAMSNRTGAAIVDAQITYNLYDANGGLLGRASATNDQYFGPERATWQFEAVTSADAFGGEYPSEIVLEAISGFPTKPLCTTPSPLFD